MRSEEYGAMFDLEDRLWWYQGMRAVTASLLDENLQAGEGLRLLDVGCGTGFSLAWLRERFKTQAAFGVDVSPHAAAYWRRRGLDTVAIASITGLPFAANAFDLVTCFDVIYQLTPEEAPAAAAEMFRVLRPGGLLFIREPAYEWLRGKHDIAVGTRHRYTLSELRLLLGSQGFLCKRATYANTLLFGAAIPHRLLSRLTGGAGSDVKPVPEWMNKAMLAALRLEARMLARLTLPFGLSAIVLAQKPDDFTRR